MADTIVLGLDGANWGVIDDWLDDGFLPNIQRLRDNGVDAVSKSEYPPVTCPNWKCYSSGKNPGGFGVFWWERIDFTKETISFPDGKSFQSVDIWDYFADADRSWAALNMPNTYPPRKIPNGEIIAGGPLCGDSGYTADPELEAELKDRFSYRVFPETTFHSNKASQNQIDETLSILESRFDVGEWYLDEYDPEFFHLTLFLLNYIQHFFWDGQPLKRAWKIIDDRIPKLEDQCDNLVLMSDHGSNEIHHVFYINNWLQEEGYLTTESDISDTIGRLGLTQERLLNLIKFFGIRDIANKAPEFIKSLFPAEEGAKREAKARSINWADTTALASGQGPLYLQSNLDNKPAVCSQLINKLETLTTPDGQPVASEVYRKEEVYSGPYTDIAPDLVIEQAPGIHITDGIGSSGTFTEPTRWHAENDRDGLFLAYGNDIRQGTLDPVSILDIAPTLLHLNGLPVPEDMDGGVLDIFNSNVDADDVSVRSPLPFSEGDISTGAGVEARLEDLGYLEQ